MRLVRVTNENGVLKWQFLGTRYWFGRRSYLEIDTGVLDLDYPRGNRTFGQTLRSLESLSDRDTSAAASIITRLGIERETPVDSKIVAVLRSCRISNHESNDITF